MLEMVDSLPEQLSVGRKLVPALTQLVPRPSEIWLCGMGGSAAAADILSPCLSDSAPSLHVHRDYGAPRRLHPDALCIFSSYSGSTEETLSAFDGLRDHAGPRLVISTGGELLRRGKADGLGAIELPPGLPPRASLGWSLSALAATMEQLGLDTGLSASLDEATALLEAGRVDFGPQVPEAENPARGLARRIYGKLPMLYAADGIGAAAARRWKTQLNENAKSLAFVSLLPESNHNEIAGFASAASRAQERFVIALHDREDHPRVQRRFSVTQEILEPELAGWQDIESRGESPLARALSLVQLGDYLSVYLAELNGVDAIEIEAIDALKSRLSESG